MTVNDLQPGDYPKPTNDELQRIRKGWDAGKRYTDGDTYGGSNATFWGSGFFYCLAGLYGSTTAFGIMADLRGDETEEPNEPTKGQDAR